MLRKTAEQSSQSASQVLYTSAAPCNKHHDEKHFISASNTELKVRSGFSLAIIDNDGEIIKRGNCVSNEVFEAVATQVVESFCKKFKAFTETDFKK